MKLLGAGLIWTSLIYAGAAYSIKLSKRIVLLEKTLLMLQEMEVQIEYLNLPLLALISEIGSRDYLRDLSFLSECRSSVNSGMDFPEAWEQAVKNSVLNYKREEKDKLLQLGANLGRTDTENQISLLNMHISNFREFLDIAKKQKLKYGSLSFNAGFLLGCMIFVMII